MNKLKGNRAASFIAVALVYILASALGVITYLYTAGAVWQRLLVADAAATVFTFIFSLIFGNASVYDPYWSVQPAVILGAFLFCAELTISKVLLVFAVMLWAVRLTANWAYTFRGLAHQDWRYTQLCLQTGRFYPIINFVGIHMVPTLVVYGATLPAVFLLQSNASFSPFSLIGLILSLSAVALQTVSDAEMQKYRKTRPTPFIEIGLWKYSRHPNYLGEILMWWGVALFVVAHLGFKWYYIVGALFNTLLFFCVSIPLAEGRQSKKEGFAEYKMRTRVLLPIRK